ncbi:hypothetical protein OG474_24050 [Kribbella sp. NBC_01505]|uniref:hypothetical protein n=1 Tax=Kribbella sp. NBC_01505 TaxID=2903580 RepID=UPI0038692400
MRPRSVLSLLVVGVLTTTVLATDGSVAVPAPDCVRALLPTLPGSVNTTVDAGDPDNYFQVGRSQGANGRYSLVRWSAGKASDLGPLGASVPTGVSYNGDVIGNAPAGDGWQGWRLRNGVRTALPTPAGFAGATAEAINSSGVIAGTAYDADGWNTRAVAWSVDGKVRVLETQNGYNNFKAADIGSDGTVVGTASRWDVPNGQLQDEIFVRWTSSGYVQRVGSLGSSGQAVVGERSVAAGLVAGRPTVFLGYPSYDEMPVAGTGPVHDVTINSIRILVLLGTRHDLGVVDLDTGVKQLLPLEDPTVNGGAATVLTETVKVYGTDFARDRQTPVRWDCA